MPPDTNTDAAGEFEIPKGKDISPAAVKPVGTEDKKTIRNPQIAPVRLPPKVETKNDGDEKIEAPRVALPKGLKESIVLLQKTELLPARTPREQKQKARALEVIKKHVFALQQGTPSVPMTADLIHASRANKAALKMERLELRARSDADIKQLLEETAALKAKIAELEKPATDTK